MKNHSENHTVSAFAPATVANVAVGFDILGFSVMTLGDTVTVTRRNDKEISIDNIQSAEPIPQDPQKNTATVALHAMQQQLQLPYGFSVRLCKGIPLSSGLGGSAACAVAAVVAANALLDSPLAAHDLVPFALQGERISSGTPHGDNVIPCLLGGIKLIQSMCPLAVIPLPLPTLFCVLVHPQLKIETRYARQILPENFPLTTISQQMAHLAGFIAALYQKDLNLLRRSLNDVLIEPHRATLVPHFYEVKAAALEQQALGCSLSGSGPTLFALATDEKNANNIQTAMRTCFQTHGIKTDAWISSLTTQGAHVIL